MAVSEPWGVQLGAISPSRLIDAQHSASTKQADWQSAYRRRLAVTDLIVVVVAVFGAQLLRFGEDSASLFIPGVSGANFTIAYTAVSVIFSVAWLLALHGYGTRDAKTIGTGTQEYRKLADASIRVFGVLTIAAFLLHIEVARAYLLLALPAGLCLLIAGRWLWRGWLSQQRSQGRFLTRVVLVGEHGKSVHVAREVQRDHAAGFQVVGAVTERGSGQLLPGIPVIGDLDELLPSIEAVEADAVVYSGSDQISPPRLREFGWELQSRSIDLIVAAALTDIAGPRIHARPVAGLSLIHVDYPEFTGIRYATKRAFDVIASALALIVLSPVLAAVALVVRGDGGPALFLQERVGLDGRRFRLVKFRSMVENAEDLLDDLLPFSDGNGRLFKMHDDPRVTRVGAFLRRHSLDELPQLWNVLRGDMSLVGPRPPLLREVQNYEQWDQRRLLVKPGITGLWQVSGRSDLSWEDSVRLDLYYVENWSLTGDLVILWRTVRALLHGHGAY
ncbi:sugar transferase [Microbacterium soli]|uniref:sugar transferase n=1 Tax=Microbacterium soli TaxID=446075 RepID=UPI0031E1B063